MSRRFQRDKELTSQLVASENYLKTRQINNIFGPHFTRFNDGVPNPVETVVAQDGITRVRGGEKVISPVSYLPFNISSDTYQSTQEQEISLKPKQTQVRTRQAPTRQPALQPNIVPDPVPETSDIVKQSDHEHSKKTFVKNMVETEIADQKETEPVKQSKAKEESVVVTRTQEEIGNKPSTEITVEEEQLPVDEEEEKKKDIKTDMKETQISMEQGETSTDAPQDAPQDEDKQDNTQKDPSESTPEGGDTQKEIPARTIQLNSKYNSTITYGDNNKFTFGDVQVIHKDGVIKSIRYIKSGLSKETTGYLELEPSVTLSKGESDELGKLSKKIIDLYRSPKKLKRNFDTFKDAIRDFVKYSQLKGIYTEQPESANVVQSGKGLGVIIEDQILPELVNSLGSFKAGNVSEEITNKIVYLAQQAYERDLISKEQYTGLMNSLVK